MSARETFPFDAVTIDRRRSVPVHRQLYEILQTRIVNGRLQPGTRLPATRAFAEALGIGRNAVIAAYEQLLVEGYIEANSGAGSRVALGIHPTQSAPTSAKRSTVLRLSRRGRSIADQPQLDRRPHKINFHPAFPDTETFPFSTWARLLARNARSRSDELLSHHSYAGHSALRQAIAEYVGVARGVDCDPDQVIVVTGAQAALDLLCRMLADPGDVAWMEEPGYIGARTALLASGVELAPLRVREEGWLLSDPALPPPRLIYTTPSCQWPTGRVMRIDERLQLLRLAERHNAWIIEDDYDGEYRLRGKAVPAMQGLDKSGRVIYVGTFGKTLLHSLRLGFMIVPGVLRDAFDRTVSVTGHSAPLVLQATLADFIREGHFATHLRRTRSLYARRQRHFVDLARRHLAEWMTVSENDSGIQLVGRFNHRLDDRKVAALARVQGIDAHPLSVNYFTDRPQHGFLLGYAKFGERESAAAIDRLRQVFESFALRRGRQGARPRPRSAA